MKTLHREIAKQRFSMAVSLPYNRYLECYTYHDLISIRDLDGNLLYDMLGPGWDPTTHRDEFYRKAIFCHDKIIALYCGKTNTGDSHKRSRFLVFDINGDYIQTLETDYKIDRFCYDKENHRLILSMDDEIQFGYLDLKGLIE